VKEFLVELYVRDREAAGAAASALRSAIGELVSEGVPVRLARAIHAVEDETCFVLVAARDAEVAAEAVRRAGFPAERIVETA